MTIRIQLPGLLQARAGGCREVTVDADRVGAALARLVERHPGLREHLLSDDGRLRRFVNVYLGAENIRQRQGLETPLGDGDVLTVIVAVAGG